MHKITHNPMKNRGSTPILTHLVGVHPRNIHTKFEANPCSRLREVKKKKKVHADDDDNNNDDDDDDDDNGHSLIASHTHSFSVTKNVF